MDEKEFDHWLQSLRDTLREGVSDLVLPPGSQIRISVEVESEDPDFDTKYEIGRKFPAIEDFCANPDD